MQETYNTTSHSYTMDPQGWPALARAKGIFRYHLSTLGKLVLWVLAVLAGTQLLAFIMPLFFPRMEYASSGVSSSLGTVLLVALVCAGIVAGKSSRFLLRFGTSRFSVWLCNILSLLAAMLLLLLGTFLISYISSAALLAMSRLSPSYLLEGYTASGVLRGEPLFALSLSQALKSLPENILYVAEYVCLYYLLACCYRRSKGWTLTVLIGVPLVFILLLLVPAVQNAIDTVMYGQEKEQMLLLVQVIQWVQKAAQFLIDKWPTVQLMAALVSLPLSYLCMRDTKQP